VDSIFSVDGSKVFPLLYSWHDLAKIVTDHCLEVGLDLPNSVLLASDDGYESFPHFFARNEADPLKKISVVSVSAKNSDLQQIYFPLYSFLKSEECRVCLWDTCLKSCIFKGLVCYERTVIQATFCLVLL
jgi:hypothetical protein